MALSVTGDGIGAMVNHRCVTARAGLITPNMTHRTITTTLRALAGEISQSGAVMPSQLGTVRTCHGLRERRTRRASEWNTHPRTFEPASVHPLTSPRQGLIRRDYWSAWWTP